MNTASVPRSFSIGRLVATPRVLEEIPCWDLYRALSRHTACDWGDVCPEDRRQNDDALRHGLRLLSAYHSTDGKKFWIITEGDRSATTILFPDEY